MRSRRGLLIFATAVMLALAAPVALADQPQPTPIPTGGGGGGGSSGGGGGSSGGGGGSSSGATSTPAPTQPTGPTAVGDGQSGAAIVQAPGVQVTPPSASTSTGEASPQPATAPQATVPAPSPSATSAAVVRPPTTAGQDTGATSKDSGVPRDALVVLFAVLVVGILVAVRAIRGRERRIGWALLGFCVLYLLVLGGLVAGVAGAAPAPPGDFTVTPGDGQVLLTWDPLPADVTIRIEQSTAKPLVTCADPGANVIVNGAPPDPTYLDTDVVNDKPVWYAACIEDHGLQSASVTAATTPQGGIDVTPPAVPAKLHTVVTAVAVTVLWTNPPDPDFAGVRVVRRIGKAPRSPSDGRVLYTGTGARFVDHPVSPLKAIYYAIYAVDRDGNVSAPARKRLSRWDPLLRYPTNGARSGRSVFFNWKPIRHADYYNLQVYRGNCCKRKVLDAHPRRVRFVRRLRPGRYTWYVFAHVRRGTSPSSFSLAGPQVFTVR